MWIQPWAGVFFCLVLLVSLGVVACDMVLVDVGMLPADGRWPRGGVAEDVWGSRARLGARQLARKRELGLGSVRGAYLRRPNCTGSALVAR